MPARHAQRRIGKRTPLTAKSAESVTPGFKRVNTRRTFEEVTEQVRDLLLGGTLGPGDRLPAERELAKMLGVGRPALREALRGLEATGLIELRKGKFGGAFVCKGKPDIVSARMSDMLRLGNVSIEELFEVRVWIETGMVRAACAHRTTDDLTALGDNVRLAEEKHLQGRYDERTAANIDFHRLLARAAHNPVAELIIQGLAKALHGLISRFGSGISRSNFRYRHDLIEALRKRDERAAVLAISRVIKSAEQMYLRLAEQHAGSANRTSSPLRIARLGPRNKAAVG
jgi:GntR family transcriptional repressor for pyruvate dehydrogenase complex